MKNIFGVIIPVLIFVNISYSQIANQWIKKYNGTGNFTDQVKSIVIDNSGNVYVTGLSYNGSSTFMYDYVTIKYSANGDSLWGHRYDGNASTPADEPNDIAIDNSGNVYVTGLSTGNNNSSDYLTIKYNSNGAVQWIQRYGGNGQDVAIAIAVDNSGNVYITGVSDTSNLGATGNCVTIKYDGNGVQQWIKTYNGAGNLKDQGNDIAVDISGNVYVTGWTTVSSTNFDYLTIKYSPSGDQLWVKTYNGPGNDKDISRKILVDNSGKVYITGQSRSTNAFYSEDIATIKYDTNGNDLWVKRYDTPESYGEEPQKMLLDGSGNLYITGYSTNGGLYRTTTVKYNSSGNLEWARRLPGNINAYAYDADLDNAGNIFVTGAVTVGFNFRCAIFKYNPAGFLEWTHVTSDPTSVSEIGLAIKINSAGNIYTAGNASVIHGANSNSDFLTMKFSPVSIFQSRFMNSNLNKTIYDNSSVYDTIYVGYSSPVNFSVTDVNLMIDTVLHTNDSDLEYYLIHNGITDTAIYQVGGSGDNFINTLLNDSASNLISGGSAPFTGSFKPSKPLSIFNNTDVNGSWILKIFDRAAGNTGTLKSWSLIFTVQNNIIGIQNISNEIPKSFYLSQNYPNPFNPVTNIKFDLPNEGNVTLKIFDILGREIFTLIDRKLNSGTYAVDWDASMYPSGIYFYRFLSSDYHQTKKMILIK